MANGWTGSSLLCRVDEGAARAFDRPAERHAFLGGRGYGVALLSEFGHPDRSPLDPSQPLVFAAGPLTGTPAPSTGRFAVVTPSPLTGTVFDGNAGGRFGVRLRQAGLDAVVVTGRAPEWSVLVIDGRGAGAWSPEADSVKVVPVRELWPECDPGSTSLTSQRVSDGLREALGPGFSLLFPSAAGRRGSLLGSLRTDDRRTFGRGGLGAALAAKRIFAVAVAGDRQPAVADPDHLGFLVYEAEKQVLANPVTSRALPQFGTAVLMQLVYNAGALPALNYRTTSWSGVDEISGEALADRLVVGRKGCFGCRIRCTPRVRGGEGPEYETLWAFGADTGVRDLAAIQEANRLANEYGLDTISAGATIACAMELGESGVLGRNLRFGDAGRLVELVAEMGEGTGFGAELADGSARFAARYEHPDAAMHVKGLELPAYDPRGMHGQGLAYATSNRGACHLRGNMLGPEILGIPKLIDRFASEGKSGILLNLQHLSAVFDSLCACKFTGFAFGEEILARLLSATTGDRVGAQDLLRIGERVWNLERLWNMAAGFTRGDDTLPARVLAEPLTDGPAAGRALELEPMLAEYYRARGWGADGRPGAEKIASLGLEEQAARLRDVAVEPGTLLPWQDWRPAVLEEPCEPAGDGSGGPSDDSPDGPGSARKESRHLRAV